MLIESAKNSKQHEVMAKEQRNSFQGLPAWATTELLRIESLEAAVAGRNKCDARMHTAKKEAEDRRALMEKIDSGRFAWRLMLKNQEAKALRRVELAQET